MAKNKEKAKYKTFGFELKHLPGELKELNNFEKDLFNVI